MRCFYNQAGTAEPTIYAQYLYDSAGNRVKKIVRTQGGNYRSNSYIDGMFEYKTDGTDEQTLAHIMDDTSRIAMIRTGDDFGDTTPAIKYNLEDHLGSSSILLRSNAILINKEEYYPFGETSFGSYAKKKYRYSGKEKDKESGLYYYGARYYMAMGCRFVSVDPLASKYPWQSPYAAFNNNPIYYTDPTGMAAEEHDGDGGGNPYGAPVRTDFTGVQTYVPHQGWAENLKDYDWTYQRPDPNYRDKIYWNPNSVYYGWDEEGNPKGAYVAVREYMSTQTVTTTIPAVWSEGTTTPGTRTWGVTNTQNLTSTTFPGLQLTPLSFSTTTGQVTSSINLDRNIIADLQGSTNPINDRFVVNLLFRQDASLPLNNQLVIAYRTAGLTVNPVSNYRNSRWTWTPGMDSYATNISYRSRTFGWITTPAVVTPPVLITPARTITTTTTGWSELGTSCNTCWYH